MLESVIKLLKKDWIFIKSSLKNLIFVALIFSLVMPWGNGGMLLVVPILVGYLFNYGLLAYEEKYKMDVLLCSLPVGRKEMCLAKYIGPLLYTLISTLVMMVSLTVRMVVQSSWNGEVLVNLLLTVIAIALIYNAVILPIILYFGAIKSRWVMMGGYVLAFILMGMSSSEYSQQLQAIIRQGFHTKIMSSLVLIGVVLYGISYGMSRGIYNRKEFK
ncbi:hypothetical protein CS063_05930 [Sporanaerobium hydrogeniformans]|uniref:Uncharacterized protein n=1 Tax=Sporanaerobium hydrogeniformans TaxID=3072179 RepID=A0AC61DEJ4_9FIRM|nr:ABC-2 transporter permease [Sporanaerobium hydrogeniformans]PHV71228.1 hypothetical protein CS063_05930 [Sporanaerobium hydrogeniformans]